MKITKAKLKQIIKEELQVVLTNEEVEEMFGEEVRAEVEAMESKEITKEAIMEEIQSDPALLDAIGKLTDSIDGLDVSIDFLSSAFTGESGVSIGAAQRQLGRAYRPKARPMPEPVRESEQFRDQQKMDDAQSVAGQQMSFERWIATAYNNGAQIDDNSPNPYDAWMSGQTPEDYANALSEGLFGGEFGKKKETPTTRKPSKTDKKTPQDKLDRFYSAVNKKMEEKKLSKPEKKEKERVVKGMKKSKGDFKQRYGDDAESVMYATATKIAKDKK